MAELTITQADVDGLLAKLDALAPTLTDGERAVLCALAPGVPGSGDDEVEGHSWRTQLHDAGVGGGGGGLFEIDDFSFDVEQTLNIGSQSTGAGAGKVTFNPFSVSGNSLVGRSVRTR